MFYQEGNERERGYLCIPPEIWTDCSYSVYQKLILGYLYIVNDFCALDAISDNLGISVARAAKECMGLVRSGAPITRKKVVYDNKVYIAYAIGFPEDRNEQGEKNDI